MISQKIPATLFTGFFGVGKTTAIRSLLSRKSKKEKWAILVNEFGEVAVDQTALGEANQDNIIIREIPGGCMCCAMNIPMKVAIAEILKQVNPDRLLIEPTGIGHPSGILDELQNKEVRNMIDIGAVICFVDPRFVGDPRIQQAEVFQDQIHLADILIATKTDLASQDDLERYYAWAGELFPLKYFIGETLMGDIDQKLLDIKPHERRLPLFPKVHSHENRKTLSPVDVPEPGATVRYINRGAGYQGCGWIFSEVDKFNKTALIDYLMPSGSGDLYNIERLKGIFRTDCDSILIDRVKDEVSVSPIAYRRDSRLEVIVPDDSPKDWLAVEVALLGFINNN